MKLDTLNVKGLTLIIGKQILLNNVTFSIPKNSIVGFVGPNGAGKTTLIKCICKLYPKYEGNIFVFGKLNESKEFIKIGYVPEKENFPKKKVIDFLTFLSKIRSVPKDAFISNLSKYTQLFDCENLLKRNLNTLSSGQKKKIMIIQALIHNPELLIMDEPTENMDPDSRIIFYQIIKELHKQGKTIFISSHQLDEIKKYITYLIILRNGQILFNKETKTKTDLFKLYKSIVKVSTQ
ncbi:MAG: ABC transporter ATP-binding protein [Mycoplasmataceae bacterium]|jgi:ABC-2 type transport system ATP-binding protein|nr:ABC transporter ATP-binding protein [Mycoplasmataceae bacterium]